MPMRTSSNAELESEVLERTVRIRAAIKEEHEPLLRSIAVLVAKTGRDLRWPEVMEIASEILHEAVQEALKHAERFDPTRSATAWVRGIAARLLLNRRRAEARVWRCVPAAVLGEEAWAAALEQHCTGPTDAAVAGRLDLEQALARISSGRAAGDRIPLLPGSRRRRAGKPPWGFPLPGPRGCGSAGRFSRSGLTSPLPRKRFFHERTTKPSRRDLKALRYLDALNAGDLEAVSALWEEASHDPELERMLAELDDAMFQEIAGKREPATRTARPTHAAGPSGAYAAGTVAAACLLAILAWPRHDTKNQGPIHPSDQPGKEVAHQPPSVSHDLAPLLECETRPGRSGNAGIRLAAREPVIRLDSSRSARLRGSGHPTPVTFFVRTFFDVRCCSCCARSVWP